jgi:thiamine-phosphate pyrophosphorylase
MMDANLNRATEGIRVAEDIVRFVLDDNKLTSQLKDIRHQIVKLLRDTRLESRDVKGDVGAKRTTKSEAKRSSILDVFTANIKRVEESVRVFEETSKLFDPKLCSKFKKLRFELYDIEQKAAILLKKKIKLDSPLYIITDNSFGHSHLDIMKEASKAGAKIFQYRDKGQGVRDKVRTAKKLSKYAKAHGLTFIVNDDPEVALKADVDGVHIGQDIGKSGYQEIRKRLGKNKLIGVSASTLKDAIEAEKMGADYIGFGPVFKTPIKPHAKPSGLRVLRKVTNRVKIPVFAIGGVCARTIRQVMASGAAGGAVIRYVSGAEHIRANVRRLLILSRRPR